MDTYHIAAIDIGKTNKKILIFDDHLRRLDDKTTRIDEIVKENIHFEDIESILSWVIETLKEFSGRYQIRALSISTHGATILAIDENGNLAIPPVAYTTKAGDVIREGFYNLCGTPKDLQRETATAEVGSLINAGKLIYFLKDQWSFAWKNVRQLLFFPQFLGYELTGKSGAEPTSIGCHTYLYNPTTSQYSSVTEALDIQDMLPIRMSNPWDVLGPITQKTSRETGLDSDCLVTLGIHDSNAALLPYLVKGYDNFVLNSTGTWCVAMHPTREVAFNPDELDKMVFYNLDVYGGPVKTSIFMGGLEFESYLTILEKIHGKRQPPEMRPDLIRDIISRGEYFILPSVTRGTGIFPDARPKVIETSRTYLYEDMVVTENYPDFFSDFDLAMAVLNISLAIQSYLAIRITGYTKGGDIFTEGGFSDNDSYLAVLTALFPDSTVHLSEMKEASAFGAAILGKAAVDQTLPEAADPCFEISSQPVEQLKLDKINSYLDQFRSHLTGK